jgi:glycosyltransferase involved in cell wall biosynthesis
MKKNILFLSHTAQLSGAEICLLELIKGLDKNKYGGVVLLPDEQVLKTKIEAVGWETLVSPFPWWVALRKRSRWHLQDIILGMPDRIRYLKKIINKYKIDVIYTNTLAHIDGAIAAKIFCLPHIWHIHEIPSAQTYLKFYLPTKWLPMIVNNLSTEIIVPSNISSVDIKWKNSNKIHVINNGIDIKKFNVNLSNNIKQELGININSKILGMIGIISENKGQADFIEAAASISSTFKNVYYLIVGAGDELYIKFLKEKIDTLNLTDRVFFLGVRDDVPQILSSIDILISASKFECFPTIILEAMASGKPVIASKSGGAEEQIDNGETGFLVPVGSPNLLAEKIAHLLSNDDLAINMGENGLEKVKKYYLTERYVDDIEHIIVKCLNENRFVK